MSKILLSSVTLSRKLIEPKEGVVELRSVASQSNTQVTTWPCNSLWSWWDTGEEGQSCKSEPLAHGIWYSSLGVNCRIPSTQLVSKHCLLVWGNPLPHIGIYYIIGSRNKCFYYLLWQCFPEAIQIYIFSLICVRSLSIYICICVCVCVCVCVYTCVCLLSHFSHLQLFATP